MAKNRFAQPLYGKIIYIYETNLTMEQLPTIFDPSTYWIDVTGLDCEVGYLVSFKEGVGLVLAPPPNEEYTFEYLKAQKLELVDAWTADKITGGFISQCTGSPVRYDSDRDTQNTVSSDLNTIYLSPEKFNENFPNGYPMRGYPENANIKQVYFLTKEQLLQWNVDLGLHRGTCKQNGWIKQAEVNAAQSKEELDAIILD